MSDWRDRLRRIFQESRRGEDERGTEGWGGEPGGFVSGVVVPTFHTLREEMNNYGREAVVNQWDQGASIVVAHEGDEEFSYAIRLRSGKKMTVAFPELPEEGENNGEFEAEVLVNAEPQKRKSLRRFTQEAIIEDFLEECAKWMDW